jgi:hypothetical protein
MKKYAGKWVALKDDQKTVIAFALSAKEALRKAQKKGVQSPFLNYISYLYEIELTPSK